MGWTKRGRCTLLNAARYDSRIALEPARVVVVGPDSTYWRDEFTRRGLPDTLAVQSGSGEGHEHHYYRLPAGVPAVRICKPGEYDVMAAGLTVAAGSLH